MNLTWDGFVHAVLVAPPFAMQLSLLSLLAVLLALGCSVSPALAATKEQWKTRVIYQLLTDRFALPPGNSSTTGCADLKKYCGGTFSGITAHLDYIQALGADAIWISPVVLNQPDAYHGYAAKDLYTINPIFGGEQGLKDLVAAAHKRDIYVMVDVVANQSVQHELMASDIAFAPVVHSARYLVFSLASLVTAWVSLLAGRSTTTVA